MESGLAASLHPDRALRVRRILWSAGFLLVGFPLVLVAYQAPAIQLGQFEVILRGAVVALVLLLITRAMLRREGRSVSEFGLAFSARTAKHLVGGVCAGALLFTIASLFLRLALPFEWELNRTILPNVITGALLFHLVTNSAEELAWRGYAFDGLIRSIGHWPAQAAVALVAAYFHVLSGWSWQVALTSTTAGSLLFALVFLRFRSIPAAIGVHVAWNWMRDLILTPDGEAAIVRPSGLNAWTTTQWQVAQAILLGVTLAACFGLLLSVRGRARATHVDTVGGE